MIYRALFAIVVVCDLVVAFSGRWIPDATLAVVEVEQSSAGGVLRCAADQWHLSNRLQLQDRWLEGCASLKGESVYVGTLLVASTAVISVVVSVNMTATLTAAHLLRWTQATKVHLPNGTSLPTPAAFTAQSTWHKFDSGTLCQTISPRSSARSNRSAPARPRGEMQKRSISTANIRAVHVVFAQHFDLGYTDFAWCVLSHYFWYILPGTALAAGADATYVYTTHPWLLYFFFACEEIVGGPGQSVRPPVGIGFRCPTAESQQLVASAVMAGQIVWHAFPFDGFNEALGNFLFDRAFDLERWLDFRFASRSAPPGTRPGNLPRVMFQVDVPGMFGIQVPRIVANGVRALYIGQNPFGGFAGAIPQLPRLFRWRPPIVNSSFEDLLVMTHPTGYGGLREADAVVDDVSGTALLVTCTIENSPPYTPQDVAAMLDMVRQEFPSSVVRASTLGAFVAEMLEARNTTDPLAGIPVVDVDIGDSWVRALASDPKKTSGFLRERRAFEAAWGQLGAGALHQRLANTTYLHHLLFILTGVEHNFGLPYDFNSWEPPVLSYIEKRDLLSNVSGWNTAPARPSPHTNMRAVAHHAKHCRISVLGDFEVGVDVALSPTTGAIENLTVWNGTVATVFSDSSHPWFKVRYSAQETGTPWMVPSNNGWGDPMPHRIAAVNDAMATDIRQLDACGFVVESNVSQRYWNNNTRTWAGQGAFTVTASFLVRSLNASGDPCIGGASWTSKLARFGLCVDARVIIATGLTSDENGLYASWAQTVDLGAALSIQVFPRPASPALEAWPPYRLHALGSSYSPYTFHPAGVCQYHVVDAVSLMSSYTDAAQPVLNITSLDATVLLFGWNNATWANQGSPRVLPQNPELGPVCTPNAAEGVWFNLWNSWNANWVVGWPWQNEVVEFRFHVSL